MIPEIAPMQAQRKKAVSLILRETVRRAALTALSALVIQITTFAILAWAALIMPKEGFAELSLIVSATILASSVFELGLNVTSTKLYVETKDEGYLRVAFAVRLACVPFSLLIAFIVAALTSFLDIGLGIALGTGINIWNGIRSTDQAREDYRSFMRSSILFSLLRALAGIGTLYWTRNAILTAGAIFALPIVAALASRSSRYAFEAFSGPRRLAGAMVGYATHVYITTVTVVAIPYLPQFFISSRLNATDVGTYGLSLMFTGPISLLVYSLRSVLLPKMLGDDSQFENFMWSWRGLSIIMAGWLSLLAGSFILAHGLDALYGERFPESFLVFLVFFAGFSFTAMIGLYSLSIHTLGVPHLSNVVGVGKFVVLLMLLLLSGRTLMSVVVITAVIMSTGELLLIVMLSLRRRRMTI